MPTSHGFPLDFGALKVVAPDTPSGHQVVRELPVARVALDPSRRGALQDELLRGIDRGEPLSLSTRRRAEAISPRSLPDVRLHRDGATRRNVDTLGSAALTVGHDIFLGTVAASECDEWLVAHEVAHAIQQSPVARPSGGAGNDRSTEGQADRFADVYLRRDQPHAKVDLATTSTVIAQKVIWKHLQDLPGNLLLIIDVDDGDFVGGCVKKIVPHAGIKLIQKTPHVQLFNAHVGFTTNALGEYCAFFYESVTGICETKCFPTKEALQRAMEEVLAWLRDVIEKVLKALAVAALLVGAAVLAFLIAQALAAALAALLALVVL
jgi:hypothetical protein